MTRTLVKASVIFTFALVAAGGLGAFPQAFLSAPIAHAQATTQTTSSTAADKKVAEKQTSPPSNPQGMWNWIMSMIVGLFAWLLGAAAVTLDATVYYTIVNMGSFVEKVKNIGVAWRILRDLGNIALIFGFVFVGISIIIGREIYGYGTKLLPMLLLAAIFINFSLFISMAVIDVGNLFATQIFAQINGGSVPTYEKFSDFFTAVKNEGISNRLMSVLGFQSIYGSAMSTTGTIDTSVLASSAPWYTGFMAILLFIVAAFVFFSLAFTLIARFIALIFVIILAPVGFAGMAIPKLSGLATMWWNQLAKQTLTAPVLLLLLYIALAVITDFGFLLALGVGGGGDGNAANTADRAWTAIMDPSKSGSGAVVASFASILLSFLVAMGLLLAVIYAAKQMSAFGAGVATKLGGRLSFGAVAMGMSGSANLAGLTGRKLGQLGARSNNRYARMVSRGVTRVSRPLENARLDTRRWGMGAVLKAANAGEAAEAIKQLPRGRVRQVQEWWQKSGQEADRAYQRETAVPRLRAAAAAGDYREIGRIISAFSDKDLETPEVRRALRTPAAAAALSQSKFDKLMDSEIPDADKAAIRAARDSGITARYTDTAEYRNPPTHPTAPGAPVPSVRRPGTNMTRGEQAVRALTNEQVSQLPDPVLANPDVYENLSLRQLGAIMRAGRIQDSTAATIGVHLRTDPTFVAYLGTRTPQQQTDIRSFWHI